MNCVPREPNSSHILTHVVRKKNVIALGTCNKLILKGNRLFYNVP